MPDKNKKNPFSLTFSRKPAEFIERTDQTQQILQTFTEEPVTDQLFLIMGVRGSGKTVLLSTIANTLAKRKDWLIIRCTPTGNIVEFLATELYSSLLRRHLDIRASFSIPVIGSVSVGSKAVEETALSRIDHALEVMDKHHQKLLIAIDEVTNSPQMREFASVFQLLIGKERPVYFLGTGLYENIMLLQNEADMTFLYRAPKIVLGPLNMAAIAQSYQKIFQISAKQSVELAKLTKGYSFAFQALGYSFWNHMPAKDLSEVLPDYDSILADASYSKLWMEMSELDRKICHAIAETSSIRVKDIRAHLGMDSNLFNIYRNRLRQRGILETGGYGQIGFALPRFDHFIKEKAALYEL